MAKSKKYVLSRIRKKIIKKAKWLIVYGDYIFRLTSGAVPSQSIGMPLLP